MDHYTGRHRARAACLALALLAGDTALMVEAARRTHTAWQVLCDAPATPLPIDAVPTVLWACLCGALAWAAVLLILAIGQLGRQRTATTRTRPGTGVWSPARLALVLLTLSGIGLTAPTASATTAMPTAIRQVTPSSETTPGLPEPTFTRSPGICESSAPTSDWRPNRPSRLDQRAGRCSSLITGNPRGTDESVTVRQGDSLWTIVARHLGPDADPATIAQQWPQWYAVNRNAIGDDPNLLQPGQQLHPPASHEAGAA